MNKIVTNDIKYEIISLKNLFKNKDLLSLLGMKLKKFVHQHAVN